MERDAPLLKVSELTIRFNTLGGTLHAVERLSFDVRKGETLAIVGESGCGKSVTSMSILRLLPLQTSQVSGAIKFQQQNLLTLTEAEVRRIRGNEITMIFQEPATSLNPVLTIGYLLVEAIRLHQDISVKAANARAKELLTMVGIPEPARRLREYPHQLSGGMKQRVMIAIALAGNPKLVIADEPTTALDVTIQAQILDLIRELKNRIGSSVILITHDLGVVAQMADRVVVMYAGRKVEEATVTTLSKHAAHPYTEGLLGAVPRLGSSLSDDAPDALSEIEGSIPDLRREIVGCVFANRCRYATHLCETVAPALTGNGDHYVACHHPRNTLT